VLSCEFAPFLSRSLSVPLTPSPSLSRPPSLFSLSRRFGTVVSVCRDAFVDAIDSAGPDTPVVVHLFESHVEECRRLQGCLRTVAREKPLWSFIEIRATDAKADFDVFGLPALVLYRNGEVVEQWVRVADLLDRSYEPGDVVELLEKAVAREGMR
jgi:hypothetical protein